MKKLKVNGLHEHVKKSVFPFVLILLLALVGYLNSKERPTIKESKPLETTKNTSSPKPTAIPLPPGILAVPAYADNMSEGFNMGFGSERQVFFVRDIKKNDLGIKKILMSFTQSGLLIGKKFYVALSDGIASYEINTDTFKIEYRLNKDEIEKTIDNAISKKTVINGTNFSESKDGERLINVSSISKTSDNYINLVVNEGAEGKANHFVLMKLRADNLNLVDSKVIEVGLYSVPRIIDSREGYDVVMVKGGDGCGSHGNVYKVIENSAQEILYFGGGCVGENRLVGYSKSSGIIHATIMGNDKNGSQGDFGLDKLMIKNLRTLEDKVIGNLNGKKLSDLNYSLNPSGDKIVFKENNKLKIVNVSDGSTYKEIELSDLLTKSKLINWVTENEITFGGSAREYADIYLFDPGTEKYSLLEIGNWGYNYLGEYVHSIEDGVIILSSGSNY